MPPVSMTLAANFSDWRFFPFDTGVNNTGGAPQLRISMQIFETNRNSPNEILRGLGKQIYEKNLKAKISLITYLTAYCIELFGLKICFCFKIILVYVYIVEKPAETLAIATG